MWAPPDPSVSQLLWPVLQRAMMLTEHQMKAVLQGPWLPSSALSSPSSCLCQSGFPSTTCHFPSLYLYPQINPKFNSLRESPGYLRDLSKGRGQTEAKVGLISVTITWAIVKYTLWDLSAVENYVCAMTSIEYWTYSQTLQFKSGLSHVWPYRSCLAFLMAQ